MKRLLVPSLVILCTVFISGTAYALPGLSIDACFAYPMPTGDFSNSAKPGYGVGGNVFFGLPMIPIKLGGHVAYNSFGEEEDIGVGDTTIIEVLPSVRYSLGLPLELVSIFAQLGLGMYKWENDVDDGTDFGICIGAGVSVKFMPGMSLVAMPLYNIVKTEDNDLTYLSLNVGVRF